MGALFSSSRQTSFQKAKSFCHSCKPLPSMNHQTPSSSQTLVTHFIEQDAYQWNTLLRRSLNKNSPREVILSFAEMIRRGLKLDSYTVVFVAKACGLLKAGVSEGNQSHAQVFKLGFGSEIIIRTALLRMYSQFGDLVAWMEHYGSMVDLLCRAGLADEAFEFAMSMPVKPDAVIWRTIVGACRELGNISIAREAIDYLIELEPGYSGNHILKSNLHAMNQEWCSVREVRDDMKSRGLSKKDPGCSSVEGSSII